MNFSGRTTLVVQCFNKPDTLGELLNSLAECENAKECHLLIYQDGITDAQKAKYFGKHEQVRDVVAAKRRLVEESFRSAEYVFSDINRGTCAACMDAIDYAFQNSENVIFTEDDTVFARDTLNWFGFALSRIKHDNRIVAASGESIFFDAREKQSQPENISVYKNLVGKNSLQAAFTFFPFVPSTCFAVNRESWALIGKTRGQPRGDEDVCALIKEQNLLCIFPIVARVSDLGMLHPNGFSVSIHGAQNVKERKNVFLTSDMVERPKIEWFRFTGNGDDLFRATVNFSKTVEQILTDSTFAAPAESPFISTRGATKLWCFSLKNFGDALTPYIFNKIGVPFELVEKFEDAELIGIGSNLDRVYRADHIKAVWSSGFMYPKNGKLRFHKDLEILGVRGENTLASIEDFPKIASLGDGGLLVREVFKISAPQDGRIALIPHMSDKDTEIVRKVRNDNRFKVIDVFSDINEILSAVKSSRFVLSTSLHGLIVADALGVPNAFAELDDGRTLEGDGFKYQDYISAVGGELSSVQTSDVNRILSDIEYAEQNYTRPKMEACIEMLTLSALRIRAL